MTESARPECPWLDTGGAAAYLDVSEAFIRRIATERRVRFYKVGKLLRFRQVDLDAFVEAGKSEPVPMPARVHEKSTFQSKRGRASA